MSLSKRKKYRGHKSFVMLPRKMLRTKEWRELRPAAKILYIHLKGKYNGSNNGKIHLPYSELEEIKGMSSHSTISGAIKELEGKGWVKRTKLGGLYRNHNEFELTGKYDDYL